MGQDPERVTAAGVIIQDGCILLEKRRAGTGPSAGLWDTPGGHLKPGESPEEALIRELEEELGITVTGFEPGLVQDEHELNTGLNYRHHIFIIRNWKGDVSSVERQHLDWLPLGAALELEGLNPLLGQALMVFMREGLLPD